jgi:hypothetical protein
MGLMARRTASAVETEDSLYHVAWPHNPAQALFPVPDRRRKHVPLRCLPKTRAFRSPPTLNGNVMAQEPALRYRVSRNGSASDWYWEVVSDGEVIDRGLAPTSAQARAQAMKVGASHAVQEPRKSARWFKGPPTTEAP